jgi:hypothetical protein
LFALAEGSGVVSAPTQQASEWGKVEKAAQDLRRRLKQVFQCGDDRVLSASLRD